MPAATRPNSIQGDLVVSGNLSAGSMSVPLGTVNDDSVAAGVPGGFIAASKVQQQYRRNFSQPQTTTTSVTQAIYTVLGVSAVVVDFRAGVHVIPIGAATVTVDLKKNGTTILNAVITISSASVADVQQVGSLVASPVAVAGDVFTIVVTATAGGGTLPTGFSCDFTIQEDPY